MSVTWDGLDAFEAKLEHLPETLVSEADTIVTTAAKQASSEVVANYPARTGTLRRRVIVTMASTRHSVTAKVRSGAPHAHLFEKGTAVRHNRNGANRGAMPKPAESQAMIPRVIRLRKQMQQTLAAMLEREGFEITST